MYINCYFLYIHTYFIEFYRYHICEDHRLLGVFFNNKPLSRLDEISIYELVLGFASKGAGKEGGEGV